MNLKLSIIIPFYGTASKALLERSLTSIHSQGMDKSSYEVIIADDKGRGLGGARNLGIEKAQGDYLLFVDADDYLFPNSLNYCIELIDTYRPDILSFGFKEIKAGKKVPRLRSSTHSIHLSGAEYMYTHNFTGSAWRHLIRKEFVHTHQLTFAEKCYHEDEDFIVKAYFHAANTLVTKHLVYAYCLQHSSITQLRTETAQLKRIQDFHAMLRRVSSLRQEDNATSLQKEALERRLHFLTIDYVRQLKRNQSNVAYIKEQIRELTKEKLLPLPAANYTWKYTIAAKMINIFMKL